MERQGNEFAAESQKKTEASNYSGKEKQHWMRAMKGEMESLQKNRTWKLRFT
jgi:hypothetical protein